MPRLLLVALLAALAGCSGGTISSGPGTSGAPAPRGPATGALTGRAPRDTSAAGTPRGPEQLQALMADLRDGDDERRARAARELRQWGPEAEPAARALALAVATSAGETRSAALDALQAVLPNLSENLRATVAEDDPHKRIAAERRLADVPAKATAALAPIFDWRLASLPDEARKPNVGYAVAGEEYAALVPLMLKAGPDADGFQAIAACAGAAAEGGKPLWERAQLTLCELARRADRRNEALAALDSSLPTRTSVATLRAVGDLGPDAKALVPLLQTLAADRDENVRKAAAEALKKIGA